MTVAELMAALSVHNDDLPVRIIAQDEIADGDICHISTLNFSPVADAVAIYVFIED